MPDQGAEVQGRGNFIWDLAYRHLKLRPVSAHSPCAALKPEGNTEKARTPGGNSDPGPFIER